MSEKGLLLVQFAGTKHNAADRKQRPGLELATKGINGEPFARTIVLYKADDQAAKDVAEDLAKDIRTKGAPHVTLEAVSAEGWSDHANRAQAAGPLARAAEKIARFLHHERPGELYVSTLTGHPAQWTALLEHLVRRAAVSLITDSREGTYRVQRFERADTSAEEQLERLADLPPGIPVLLTGPTGAGKSRAARALHEAWKTKGDFQHLNCAALPRDLLEAELFGYEKGAFTGATSRTPGAFERADHGTLFLDEVGELGLDTQAKLLTALDPRRERGRVWWELRRLGGKEPTRVEARIVLGTNRDLHRAASEGTFRVDLLGRIAFRTLELPPLCRARHRVPGAYLDLLDQEAETYSVDKNKPLRFAFHREAFRELTWFALSPESTWTWNYRDIEHSARRLAFAAWTDQRGTSGDHIYISPEHVAEEIARLKATWKRLDSQDTASSSWSELEREAGAERVAQMPLIVRYEANWLVRALKETNDNRAAAWRWLVDQKVYAPEGAPNASAAFSVRWNRIFSK